MSSRNNRLLPSSLPHRVSRQTTRRSARAALVRIKAGRTSEGGLRRYASDEREVPRMTPDGTPDHQLHQFLTAARARLRPEDIGITRRQPPRRRAAPVRPSRCPRGIGPLVQRLRERHPSAVAVRRPGQPPRPASAPDHGRAERLYLHLLATGHEPVPSGPDEAVDCLAVRPVLQQLLASLGPGLPAIACGIAWNVIAWNQAITDHLAGDAKVRPGQSNVITWLFTSCGCPAGGAPRYSPKRLLICGNQGLNGCRLSS
jgi:MmyB-like transcription regulator ligand binding domain